MDGCIPCVVWPVVTFRQGGLRVAVGSQFGVTTRHYLPKQMKGKTPVTFFAFKIAPSKAHRSEWVTSFYRANGIGRVTREWRIRPDDIGTGRVAWACKAPASSGMGRVTRGARSTRTEGRVAWAVEGWLD